MKRTRITLAAVLLSLVIAGCDAAQVTAADGPGGWCNPQFPTGGSGC
jgi:hypothetical protein